MAQSLLVGGTIFDLKVKGVFYDKKKGRNGKKQFFVLRH
jgi:hypothetical protein